MLKFVFFMALVGLACAEKNELKWNEIPVVGNSSQCIFRLDRGLLSCRSGNSSVIECPAMVVIPEGSQGKSDIVGIARVESDEDVTIESTKYYLYPRIMQNETYLNHTIAVDDKPTDLVLYFSEDSSDMSGVRIKDLKCFKRLVKLFNDSAMSPHEVKVGKDIVKLLGEILLAENTQSKRWFGFGGLGLMGGWGWGMGWGWPMFGLGMWGR